MSPDGGVGTSGEAGSELSHDQYPEFGLPGVPNASSGSGLRTVLKLQVVLNMSCGTRGLSSCEGLSIESSAVPKGMIKGLGGFLGVTSLSKAGMVISRVPEGRSTGRPGARVRYWDASRALVGAGAGSGSIGAEGQEWGQG